jgi:hypothetical protein
VHQAIDGGTTVADTESSDDGVDHVLDTADVMRKIFRRARDL